MPSSIIVHNSINNKTKNKILNLLFISLILLLSKLILTNQKNLNKLFNKKSQNFLEMNSSTKTNQLFSVLSLSPLQALLETIANHKDISFCIKLVVGIPMKYRSYTCPPNMKIYDDSLTVCQKDCPKGMIQGIQNCEKPCKQNYTKVNNYCVNNNNNNKKYLMEISPIEKSDPICINGYFLNGFCNSCMGHTDYSNGICLTPCNSGAPSESFCAFKDDSNRYLSVINHYWAEFIRNFYQNLFNLFKTGALKRDIYKNVQGINDVAEILINNKDDNKIQNDCGKVMIYIRDIFGVNMNDAKQFLRNNFFKMFSRYAVENNEDSNDILNVVDDLINFNGDYLSPYLDTKQYGIVSLPLTVANLMQHLCVKNAK